MFSIARAVVFTAVAAIVLLLLMQGRGQFAWTYSSRLVIIILAVAYGSALVQYWASRVDFQMSSIAFLMIVLDQGLFAGVAYVTGGVASGATSLLGVACLVGGLLLGVPGAVAAALAGVFFFSLLVLFTQTGRSFRPPDQPEQIYALEGGQAAFYFSFNLLMLLLVGLLASYLAERLQTAGGEVEDARRRAEQAERMAVLGQLAAGLAHEIRNPIGSISASVQMLKTGVEREEDRQLCDIVLRESQRLDELVSDMVDLSRPRRPDMHDIDLAVVVAEVVELAARSGRGASDVRVTAAGAKSAPIRADAGQMRQVVWNLVRNAIQASGSGGEVRVRLETEPRVVLSVEDDGVGIDSQAMEQLFDAFFTTRSKGTGLGLAVVKRIVDEHGFSITVRSDRGEGAAFIVDFGEASHRAPVA